MLAGMLVPVLYTNILLTARSFLPTAFVAARSLHDRCNSGQYFNANDSTRRCSQVWARKLNRYYARCAEHIQTTEENCTNNCTTPYSLQSTINKRAGAASFDPYEPEWSCDEEERVGDTAAGRRQMYGDGLKFVCAPQMLSLNPRCLVYSFGSSNDFSFERGIWRLSDKKCEIHVFDPTPAAWQNTISGDARSQFNGSFHKTGLTGVSEVVYINNTYVPALRLATHMHMLGHSGRRITILKVDIEGSEYDAFKSVFANCSRFIIDQLIIELHLNRGGKLHGQIHDFFEAARRCGLRLFHKERNHWGCKGWKCVEFSFLREDVACDTFNYVQGCDLHCRQT